MSLRTSFIGTAYLRRIEKHLLPHIARSGVSANPVTILGVALAALAPMAYDIKPSPGPGVMAVSAIADALDGRVAQKSNQVCTCGTTAATRSVPLTQRLETEIYSYHCSTGQRSGSNGSDWLSIRRQGNGSS